MKRNIFVIITFAVLICLIILTFITIYGTLYNTVYITPEIKAELLSINVSDIDLSSFERISENVYLGVYEKDDKVLSTYWVRNSLDDDFIIYDKITSKKYQRFTDSDSTVIVYPGELVTEKIFEEGFLYDYTIVVISNNKTLLISYIDYHNGNLTNDVISGLVFSK